MDPQTQAQIQERLKELPPIVLNAINSADVQKELRALAENHKLHVDQWAKLENEVMLTLLAFADPVNLVSNIQSHVGTSAEEAAALAGDINRIVFEPIRQELERGLEHPEAKEKAVSNEETARQEALASEQASSFQVPASSEIPNNMPGSSQPTAGSSVVPATPPQKPPAEKAVRAPVSSSYSARQASTERKTIEGDPYREPPA